MRVPRWAAARAASPSCSSRPTPSPRAGGHRLAPRHVLGCVAEGVVAGHRELESGPGTAVWAASLPGAEIETFHSVAVETEDGVTVTSFPDLDGADLVALLVDPFSFPASGFLSKLNEEEERAPVVGGLAAGG